MINPYMDQEEIRDSDFFTMDDLEKVKEVFGDRLDYIDNMSSGSLDIKNGLNRLKPMLREWIRLIKSFSRCRF